MEGTSSKNKQLCSDFKLVENILAKWLLILPQEEDYGFNNEKKNKGMVVKLIQRGSLVETIKDPDHPEALCFQIWGAAPPCFYAMGRGSKPEAAGLSAGQCILKVNCSSTASEGVLGVLKHFQAFQSCGQEALILEALAADDSAFLQNCGWLLAMSTAIIIMCHYDFCNIFNTKMESIDQGITCYQQEDQGLSLLLKQEDREVQDAYLQLFTKLDMAFKEMKHFVTQINRLLSTIMESTPNGACYPHLAEEASSSLMVCVDSEMDRTDHRGIKKVCFKLSEENLEDSGHNTMSYHGCQFIHTALQSVNSLQSQLVAEFKQKEECMACGWILIQISIQEDPWNLPSSIMTLVVNSQRYVEDGKNQLLLALLKMYNAEVQLHRYAKFCQALVATMCTFSEQLLEALSYGYNSNGEYEENSKEEWAMLEDIWVTLSELDSVTFSFKQLDENCVANTNVFYHIEGSQQALKVVFYLNGYHFSKLPRQENKASL
ncbi:Phosphatidylinositol 3,4,5-trisphosphate-dependent Rac exchanger 1 protein [Sciurus carolinensis]|uniref:Phosphatidylinositol 3,4,5-trisphosphate-dependent Rac exchanger 1 protein n=1 Tax=Sciurus carolinensis TaxID=30640 RepID=A0AA41SPK6_SCICA|nr:Phosphatidylinositol 3,4,5-trisphosphate-dependent Rac exchanger 1 protein [Sciurus carolinensis]